MARSFALSVLRDRVRERADLVHDHHITDAEIDRHISASYAALYDILVQSGISYFEATTTYASDGNTDGRYDLPYDFYGALSVQYLLHERWVPLTEIMIAEVYRYTVTDGSRAFGFRIVGTQIEFLPAPPTGQTYRLLYVPGPLDLAATALGVVGVIATDTITMATAADAYNFAVGMPIAFADEEDGGTPRNSPLRLAVESVDGSAGTVTFTANVSTLAAVAVGDFCFLSAVPDARTVDGVSGWEEYVVIDAAIKCINKQESSPVALERELERITRRIESAAENRMLALPRRVVAVTPENRGVIPLPGDWEDV